MSSFALFKQPGSSMAMRNLLVLLTLIPVLMGCQALKGSPLGDGIETRSEQVGSWPVGIPKTIYVSDFALQSESYKAGRGVRGLLPGRSQKKSVSGPHSNPEQRTREIVEAMSRSLIESLIDKGFSARRLSSSASALPGEGWLLQGVFTEIDEGNRIKRAIIGFGRGASRMEAQIAVSNLASANPKAPFIVFGTVKSPKKMPGAIVTNNPYVAAAKFIMEKNASEKDIQKTAEQITDRILEHAQQFKEQAESVKSPR